ncbi:MAG: hypothetical protein LBJ72_06425 [Dysgonamonadaceae bacterium]|jgi:hypothetical protein|nr:hypothetical protein [Dysgonamonadaceae bacterium]
MQLRNTFSLLTVCMFLLLSCNKSSQTIQMVFSSSEESSSYSWPLSKIAPDLPNDWSSYNYLVLEMKTSSSQRFQAGIVTPDGVIAKSIQPFPGAWVRFSIPLEFYRELPPSAMDMAATYNKARDLGQINIHLPGLGTLEKVTGLHFRMLHPVNDPVLEIRSVSLTMENPGDTLLQQGYLVDSFGQWNTKDWPGKVKSREELQSAWEAEDAQLSPLTTGVSKYGGYTDRQLDATGYFRTARVDGKWWFVDPEGYLFLSVGVDCMNASVRTRTEGREYIYEYLKEGTRQADFYRWNLEVRYGENVSEAWVDKAVRRMQAWGLNTVGNWSSGEIIASDKTPFVLSLRGLQMEKGIMGLPDIYDPEYAQTIDKAIAGLTAQYKNNPWLLGYFVGNEQPWPGQENILCDRILTGKETPVQKELRTYIEQKGDSPETRRTFIYETFGKFLKMVNAILKKHDPNHLNLGIRFGGEATDELLSIAGKHFDVFSFNCYRMQPTVDFMNRIEATTGLPMLIGEYHFGMPDRGMAAGIVQVSSYEDRANAYRYYNEQGYSHPSLIGAHWFQWIDQPNTGRMDGENYNIGLLDITDRPYPEMVKAMQETHRRLYNIHRGELAPFNEMPKWVSY